MDPRAAPLFGARVDFQRYTSCHDDWLFHFRHNLRLHNEVKRFELRQEGDVKRRLALNDQELPSKSSLEKSKQEAEIKFVVCGKKIFADYPSNVDLLPPVQPRKPRDPIN